MADQDALARFLIGQGINVPGVSTTGATFQNALTAQANQGGGGLLEILSGLTGGANPLLAGIQTAGGIFGAGVGAIQNIQANRASGRVAAQLAPIIEQLREFDTTGLSSAAGRQIQRGAESLSAGQIGRGIFQSGAAGAEEARLRSDVLGNLAQFIESSRTQRLAQAGQLQQHEGFGFFDQETGRTRNK